MKTVTIRLATEHHKRVPRGETPEMQLTLADNERVLDATVRQTTLGHSERKTVDWWWSATIVREEPVDG